MTHLLGLGYELSNNIPITLSALGAQKSQWGWDGEPQPAASLAHAPPTQHVAGVSSAFLSLPLPTGSPAHQAEPALPGGDCGGSSAPPASAPPTGEDGILSCGFRFLHPPNPQTILHIFKSPLLFPVSSPPFTLPRPPKKRERNYKSPSFVSVPTPHLSGRRARRLE